MRCFPASIGGVSFVTDITKVYSNSLLQMMCCFFAETHKVQPFRGVVSSEFYSGCCLILFILTENRRSSLVTSLQTKQSLFITVLAGEGFHCKAQATWKFQGAQLVARGQLDLGFLSFFRSVSCWFWVDFFFFLVTSFETQFIEKVIP